MNEVTFNSMGNAASVAFEKIVICNCGVGCVSVAKPAAEVVMVSDGGASTRGRIPKNRERDPAARTAQRMMIEIVLFTRRHYGSPCWSFFLYAFGDGRSCSGPLEHPVRPRRALRSIVKNILPASSQRKHTRRIIWAPRKPQPLARPYALPHGTD